MGDTGPVAQRAIELILMRQLASHLTTPVFIVDAEGVLVFYNEPAEAILGHSYEVNGEMPMEEWSVAFRPTREDGRPVAPAELPLVIAVKERRPAYLSPVIIVGGDDTPRRIAVAAFPLQGQRDRLLGAAAILWEV
jgi:PAS domain-containing protein